MSEEKMLEIIERIKSRRIELGMSYQDLAEKTGMSKSTLQRYETGAIKNIPLDKLEDLANALNMDLAYIMGWEEKEERPSYYLNPETAKIAQELYENPEMQILFDAARDAAPEDLLMAAEIIKRMSDK